MTGVGLRDDDNTTDLPPYMMKRGLYKAFCWNMGVVVNTDAKGRIQQEKRTDEAWIGEPNEIPGWQTFTVFWEREYPHLQIRRPVKDVCGYCFEFLTKNKAIMKKKLAIQEADSDTDSDESIDINGMTEDLEEAILLGAQHVNDAQAQQAYVLSLKQKALSTNTIDDIPHRERTYLFYFDYAQNVDCPQLGSEQPGEMYYYSPLNINIFGIVDANAEQETLTSYCYHEGQGAKGGDNVTSMLYHYLKSRNLLVGGGGHLVLVCDNCAGQNKNRMVVQFAVWLHETGMYNQVSLLFLVA